jgi:uroporphyrinogen decarboxylase
MIYIKKDFEPDYNNIVLAAKNLQPKRTPLYEHVVSSRIFEEVTGIRYAAQTGDNKLDTTENYKNFNNMFKALGYDAVCYEICAAGFMPGSGSLGGHKDGEIKVRADFDRYEWDKIPDIYFDKSKFYLDCMREALASSPGMKLIGGVGNGVFECVQDITGFMDLCYIRSDDPELFALLFKSVGDMLYKIWDRFLDLYDDMFCVYRFGDDLGYKISPMLAPDDVRGHIIPQYARIINLIKNKTGKPFLLHSCGNLFEVMDDIIKTGINAKHSNEDVIAPFSEWVRRYGDKIGLFGGIDTDALCDISGIDIESYTREVIAPVINKPGIAIGSGNSITDYVSPGRFAKMNEIVRIMRGE